MASSKFMSQVSALSDTGLNMPANGFNQKSKEPVVPSALHNRGMSVGGKVRAAGGAHVTGGAHVVGGGAKVSTPQLKMPQIAAIHANNSSPKVPHPAMAKNSGGKPGVKWG